MHHIDFKEIINKRVWRKSKRVNMPSNRRLIDSKNFFKKKSDGKFRARLVARVHTKITGVDFTQNYSPVVTDVTLCVILIMWLINNWYSHSIDF